MPSLCITAQINASKLGIGCRLNISSSLRISWNSSSTLKYAIKALESRNSGGISLSYPELLIEQICGSRLG